MDMLDRDALIFLCETYRRDIDDLRDALADANADLLKAKTGTGGTDAQAERLREARIVMRALLQSIPRDSLAGTMIAAWLDAGDGEVGGDE